MGILGAMAVLVAHEAKAEPWFAFGSWGGSLDLGYERERLHTRTDSGLSDLTRRRTDEQLNARNSGFYVMDPRLLTGNLGLTVDYFQEQERVDGAEQSLYGRLTGYTFDAGLLPAKPYSAALFANRNQSILDRPFGGRSDIAYESRGTTLRLREDSVLKDLGVPYFNPTLGVRQERSEETTTMLGQTLRRDEVRDTLTLEANKGFGTADLGFRYEQSELDNRAFPDTSFQTRATDLTYSLDFGPTRNRRWDSRIHRYDYRRLAGDDGRTFLTVDEQLRLDHRENLFTDYRYLLSRIAAPTGDTTTQTGTIHGQHRLYRNLTTDITGQGMHQDLPDGRRAQYAGQLDLNYQRNLPRDGRVFGRFGGRYQVDDNDLATSSIAVYDEPHTAPSPLGAGAGFTLNNPFVVVATIVVVDARGGGRVTATPGVDYDVVPEGDYVKIVPLATSPLILPGDPLLVSYSYEAAPSMRFSTVSRWIGGGVDFRWIAFTLARNESDQTLLSGQDGRFLDDQRQDTAELELRGDWNRIQARATARHEVQDSRRLAYTRAQFNQFLSARLPYNFTLGLQAEQSSTDFTVPLRAGRTRSLRATLDRYAANGWHVSVFGGTRTLEDSALPAETVREGGVRARRRLGKLDIVPSFTWSELERGPVEADDRRLMLRLVRRF
jgi:hypothetical protein